MSDATFPSKRRKTRHNLTMATQNNDQPTWPLNQLPVELFVLIAKHLPRSNIQSMRLVNREFEQKISEYLFRVVVVPFKPEIYGINPEPALSGSLQGSVMLQDKGMRVFQGYAQSICPFYHAVTDEVDYRYGHRIKKFAMSFEFDENKLANPPLKSDQEAITSFWGIYRWPYQKYNRYAQLEGLEQTADETRTMAKALRFITSARELGLSIDGGMGWLAGPDINQKVLERGEKPTVFGDSRFIAEPKTKKNNKASRSSDSMASQSNSSVWAANERMLQEAGYEGEALDASMRVLMETEDVTAISGTTNPPFDRYLSPLTLEGFRRAARTPRSLDNGPIPVTTATAEDYAQLAPLISDDEDIHNEELQLSTTTSYVNGSKFKTENCPLKPNDLTNAQREMLLEIEWAQRAFMQSYAIAVIDNPFTFRNIESLTIARLPNRHLPLLRREDFWDSLPALKKLSLAIIPDWRDVVKLPTSWVQDNKIAPSQSVSGVYQLLHEQISHRKNINTLHFEWLCGGEYADGLFSRNQHILAAPLVSKAMDMVNRVHTPSVLMLPHVKHLSMKNCWASPHIMGTFIISLKKAALQSLTLDSVSLTAPVALNAQPQPLTGHAANPHNAQQLAGQQAAANHLMANFQGAMVAQNPNAALAPAALGLAVLQLPPPVVNIVPITPMEWLVSRTSSWSHLIDTITPGTTLAAIRHDREMGPEPEVRGPTKLKKLEFKSCGYIRLPLDFDQTVLDHPDVQAPQIHAIAKRANDIECHMMKPMDSALGVIVNHMAPAEVATLENAWHMTVGGLANSELALEARLDGISNAGRGRFDGLIEVASTSSSNR
ncbi:hypothetical protein LHYA1_G008766 [Lachnellula hyalina]|uniref:F-box domain-containing protein n=1 Tax=Lachnellula hyalina TaxID=1316788 RepID=A0A8H8QTQ7_9HELO|nr:uncharacterized protein LHYA1_G008766 [Lachnellula hyalina]TVY22589.1 hypothetical protein LHYA1_G008766 [Lachnellula hyalina]